MYMGVVLRTHSFHGESCIQRNASGEVATSVIKLEAFAMSLIYIYME